MSKPKWIEGAVQARPAGLEHVFFEGELALRPRRPLRAVPAVRPRVSPSSVEPLDGFISWALTRGGLCPAAYRPGPLHRRLPACLRALKVSTPGQARRLLEQQPRLLSVAVNSLLIGVTEFFRDAPVFEALRTRVVPSLASSQGPLRVWSAACSNGAELYSVAILLTEAGLGGRSILWGADCRADAIAQARQGLYDAQAMGGLEPALRKKYFEPVGSLWRPVRTLQELVRWKTANLLTGVEPGPWDLILWRNNAMYLSEEAAAAVWRRLASVLAPGGVLVVGKAEQPPADLNLSVLGRCLYRSPGTGDSLPATRMARPPAAAILGEMHA